MGSYVPVEAEYESFEYSGYDATEYENVAYEAVETSEYPYPEYEYPEYNDYYPIVAPAPQNQSAGFLPGITFPILAVLLVSTVLILALSNVTPVIALPQITTNPETNEGPNSAEETTTSEEEAHNNPVSGQLAPLFTREIQHWGPQIIEWAQEWNLDPNLVATVMQIESCGNPTVASSAGAMGLFQVMPFHFSAGEDGYDIETNARRGLSYLRQSLNAHGGQERLALAGYNGGINGSKRPESQWANETQRYVTWGNGIFEDARQGKIQSQSLDEWLGRGGAGLCKRASQSLGLN